MGKPKLNTALTPGGLGRQTRTVFEGTTARVFPLKANMFILRNFCDSYLNIAPEIVQFRPTLPYVLLMVLDYGKMAAETANAGWVSQREVAFAVPLEWYDTRDPENPKFIDYAAVCPFIYVDDEISLAMGRRVYGWPKVKVWAGEEVNPWVDDPNSDLHLLNLSTMVFPELYAGKRQKPQVFLDVRRSVLPTFTTFPADPSHPSNPWSVVPEALKGYTTLLGSAFEMFTQPPQLGYPPRSPLGPFSSMQRMASWSLSALTRNPLLNNVTLKQFRDAHHPDCICYQALVNSVIQVKRFNGMGILGESNQLMGDPTGGFSVGMRRYAAQPVVESLGLEVSQELKVEGVTEAILRPALPFWMDVDLEYSTGDHIAWRTKRSGWHTGEPGEAAEGSVGSTSRRRQTSTPPEQNPAPFNTARGAALQGVTGPFEFPNATVRVLPLMADPKRLTELCNEHLENDFFDFEAWGSYVYLVVTSYDEMSSATNNIGWWADRELNFFVPVRGRLKKPVGSPEDEKGELVSVGIVPMFSYTNTSTAAITGAEIQGLPSVRATLTSPADVWMGESGPFALTNQPLLSCETQVLPALYMGQKAKLEKILEIDEADVLPFGHPDWRHIKAYWGHILLDDHRRKVKAKREKPDEHANAMALALEVLALKQPINVISLKQFGDAHDPALACYQSIVRLRQVIEHVYDLREMENRLHVRIHRQPTQPIVEKLGLQIKWTDTAGAVPVDVLQPSRPFWMKVALRAELGQTLCWRSGSESWQLGDELDEERPEERKLKPEHRGYFEPMEGWRAGVGRALLDWPSKELDPLGGLGEHWVRNEGKDEKGRLSHSEAVQAVDAMEPQMVLEPILSRHWGRWADHGMLMDPWRQGQLHGGFLEKLDRPDFCIRTDSIGKEWLVSLPVRSPGEVPAPHTGELTDGGLWYSEDETPRRRSRK